MDNLVVEDYNITESDATGDLAKVLATSLIYLKKELSKIDEQIETRLSSFQNLSEVSIETAKKEAIEEAIRRAIPELPDTLIYESHLNELKYNFDLSVNNLENKLNFEHEYLREHNHDRDYSLVEHTHEDKANKEHIHENYSEKDHTHENLALAEHSHDNYLQIETFQKEIGKANSQFESLVSSIGDINLLIEETVTNVRNELHEDTVAWNDNVLSINESQEELKNNLLEKLQEYTNILETEIEKTNQEFNTLCEGNSSEIESLKSWVGSQLDSLMSSTRDLSDGKADVNHSHPDLASLKSVQDVKSDVQSAGTKIANINSILLKMESEIRKKLNVEDGIIRSELDNIIEQTKKRVLAEIPEPEDGKDGVDWEFKFHPHQRHIFMYKRSDETEWKHQDLSPKYNDTNTSPLPQQGNIMTGGGLAMNEIATSPSSIYYDENGAIVFGRYATTYRVGVTDENGYWEVDITNMNFEVVTEAIASGEMISIIDNPDLAPVERKIDYQVESISLTKITGYAFQQRLVTHLAGNEDYGTETAGAGYNVTCRITGSIAPETTEEP